MTGKIQADELGINLEDGKEKEVFRWFLASFLFGKRIQQNVARRTYDVFIEKGLDNPVAIQEKGWQGLVNVLGEGHYVRYDESIASRLLDMSQLLGDKYGGKIINIYKESKDQKDLEKRLQEFKGVGPKTVEIFMRDMKEVWYG